MTENIAVRIKLLFWTGMRVGELLIINPILCDKLRLKFNTTELLCNWTKKEIDDFHNGKMEIQDYSMCY